MFEKFRFGVGETHCYLLHFLTLSRWGRGKDVHKK